MPLLYWLTISAYIGAGMIGFLQSDVYQEWLAKSEAEQAAIIEAAVEADDGDMPEFVIIMEGETDDDSH